MSERAADMVCEFHKAFGLPTQSTPALIDDDRARFRQRLLGEETREVAEAVAAGDLPGIAQELADVVYVVYGTALTYGIDLDAVLAEVHRANMSKLDADGRPLLRGDGKVLKSPLYRPPDVAAVLAAQEFGSRLRRWPMLDLLLRRGYWRRCQHHSHRWPYWRTCLRGQSYDSFCADHGGSCFNGDCHYPRGTRP